jgi:hypothetical protein
MSLVLRAGLVSDAVRTSKCAPGSTPGTMVRPEVVTRRCACGNPPLGMVRHIAVAGIDAAPEDDVTGHSA